MTFVTFTPPRAPSIDLPENIEGRWSEAQFGDGYKQATPDGLNAVTRTAELRFPALTTAQAEDLEAFLDSAVSSASPFYYKLPGHTTVRLWEAKGWSRKNVSGSRVEITMSIKERFDADSE